MRPALSKKKVRSIISMWRRGMKYRDIAESLNISRSSVQKYVSIYKKKYTNPKLEKLTQKQYIKKFIDKELTENQTASSMKSRTIKGRSWPEPVPTRHYLVLYGYVLAKRPDQGPLEAYPRPPSGEPFGSHWRMLVKETGLKKAAQVAHSEPAPKEPPKYVAISFTAKEPPTPKPKEPETIKTRILKTLGI